jgi:hypothetical protein
VRPEIEQVVELIQRFPNAIVIQRSSEANIVQDAIHTAAVLNPVGNVDRRPGNYQSLLRADAGRTDRSQMVLLKVGY